MDRTDSELGGIVSVGSYRSPLGDVRHACAFFGSRAEAYRVLLPFIAEGFAIGDKAIHVIRPDAEAEHIDRLETAGVAASAALASGQLEILHNSDVYLVSGRFDPERMLSAFEAMAADRMSSGFATNRIVCDMEWSSQQHHHDLMIFEARVNRVWQRYPDLVICVYDLTALTGEMVVDIMRTHPLVLIGDGLQENPFFVPPDQFLRERGGQAEIKVPFA